MLKPEDVEPLEVCLHGLQALSFPVLARPPGGTRTAELIAWETRLYAFCLLSHARQLLDSFLLLVREQHWPTTFYVGRGIFELAGQGVLVLERLNRALDANDYDAAHTLLASATMGNRHMREKGRCKSAGGEWPAPIHVMDAIRALDDFFKDQPFERDEMMTMYGWLSEFSHPNMAALTFHCVLEEDEFGHRARPISPSHEAAPLHETVIALSLILYAAHNLLGRQGYDSALTHILAAAREELSEARRRRRESRVSST